MLITLEAGRKNTTSLVGRSSLRLEREREGWGWGAKQQRPTAQRKTDKEKGRQREKAEKERRIGCIVGTEEEAGRARRSSLRLETERGGRGKGSNTVETYSARKDRQGERRIA